MGQAAMTTLRLGQAIVLGALLAGCAGTPDAQKSAPEQQIGDALRLAKERQVLNPEASETRTPVEGLGATTAPDVLSNYHDNQKTGAQVERQERQRDNGLSDR